jgi:hypothetical protein
MVKLTRTMNKCHSNTELSPHEETRCQFNGGRCAIKLRIDVHQDFYVVVVQEGGANPKPPQRFQKEAFLCWTARIAGSGAEVHAVDEACGFGCIGRNVHIAKTRNSTREVSSRKGCRRDRANITERSQHRCR